MHEATCPEPQTDESLILHILAHQQRLPALVTVGLGLASFSKPTHPTGQ